MNRAVRRVSVACLLLFLALLVNANILQVVDAKSLRNNPHNSRVLLRDYSRPRGQIVIGGAAVAESVQTNDRLKYQRVYSNGPGVRADHRLLLADRGGDRHRAGRGQRALRRGRPAVRPAGAGPAHRPHGAGRQRRPDHRPARAGRRVQRAQGPGRRGRRASTRARGKILALATSPSYDPSPADLARHGQGRRRVEGAQRRQEQPAGRPGAVRDLPARLAVQGGHVGGGAGPRRHSRHGDPGAARS